MKRIFALLALAACALGAWAFGVDTIRVEGAGFDGGMPAVVITPDGAGTTATRYPTVYLLHGYGGDAYNWYAKQPRLGELADSYGMVIVMPGVGNSWYLDAPGNPGQQVETFFTSTLVPYIDSHYPTITDRSKRAVTGLSMGGHGAFLLGMRHPDLFGAVGSMSGGVDIRPFPNNWKISTILGPYEENAAAWDAVTAAANIDAIKAADLAITFDCGVDDFFAEVNNNLHRALQEAGVPHDYTSRPGRHSWGYWNNSVLYHLLFFNEFFNRAE